MTGYYSTPRSHDRIGLNFPSPLTHCYFSDDCRSNFPLNLQFACCCRFIIDDAMSPTLKVKARVLDYLKDLLIMMPVDAISNPTSEMVKSIARIITWSTEPKSADVRRVNSHYMLLSVFIAFCCFKTFWRIPIYVRFLLSWQVG